MNEMKKTLLAIAVALCTSQPVLAQTEAEPASVAPDRQDEIAMLLEQLSDPDLDNWQPVQDKIMRLWSQSGSASADLLLERGKDALEEDDFGLAVEHLTALTDHAPDFAEGWNARASAFFRMEEFGLAMRDIQRVLVLNPSHFEALTGLGYILEQLDNPEASLEAFRLAAGLHPHREDIRDAMDRLERRVGGTKL